MRTSSPELTALINGSNQFIFADLITIMPIIGPPLYLTNADVQVVSGGNTFLPYTFERGSTRLVVGIEVDTLDLTLFANSASLINGIPAPQFAQNGGFDGATVKLERTFMASWGAAPTGALLMFSGRVSDTAPSRTAVQLTVKSDLEILNIKMPRNMYQAGCIHTLFDSGCTANKASFAVAGSVASGSNKSVINSVLGNTAGYFDGGTIEISSGVNVGLRRTVKSFANGVFTLILPLPNAPGVGDAFTAYPGCDKQQTTCQNKFSNLTNYRGYPYVPVPEAAV